MVGLVHWMGTTHRAVPAEGFTWLGCGLGRGGERRAFPGDDSPIPAKCDNWANTWAAAITKWKPDVAVVEIGPWEVVDRKLPGDTVWRHLGDPVYDHFLLSEMLTATDVLSRGGAEVIWLTSPPIGVGASGDERTRRGPMADPARMQRLNELLDQLPARRPGTAHVVDLAGWVASQGDDVRLRPDGVHFSNATAIEVATAWLGPTLVDEFRRDWKKRYLATH
jgi:hypothetical protein